MPKIPDFRKVCLVSLGGYKGVLAQNYHSDAKPSFRIYISRQENENHVVGSASTIVVWSSKKCRQTCPRVCTKGEWAFLGTYHCPHPTETYTAFCISEGIIFAGTNCGRIVMWTRWSKPEGYGLLGTFLPPGVELEGQMGECNAPDDTQAIHSLIARKDRIISGHADGRVHIRFIDEEGPTITICAHKDPVRFLSLMHNHLMTASNTHVKIWDIDTLELEWVYPKAPLDRQTYALWGPELRRVQGIHLGADGKCAIGWLSEYDDASISIHDVDFVRKPHVPLNEESLQRTMKKRERAKKKKEDFIPFNTEVCLGRSRHGFTMQIWRGHIFVQHKGIGSAIINMSTHEWLNCDYFHSNEDAMSFCLTRPSTVEMRESNLWKEAYNPYCEIFS
jgi:hypothetical protein